MPALAEKTRHAPDCRRAFRNLDATCPRCQELKAGAKPRPGWSIPLPRTYSLTDVYCFCPGTSLAASRCPLCGKRPYTD